MELDKTQPSPWVENIQLTLGRDSAQQDRQHSSCEAELWLHGLCIRDLSFPWPVPGHCTTEVLNKSWLRCRKTMGQGHMQLRNGIQKTRRWACMLTLQKGKHLNAKLQSFSYFPITLFFLAMCRAQKEVCAVGSVLTHVNSGTKVSWNICKPMLIERIRFLLRGVSNPSVWCLSQ